MSQIDRLLRGLWFICVKLDEIRFESHDKYTRFLLSDLSPVDWTTHDSTQSVCSHADYGSDLLGR